MSERDREIDEDSKEEDGDGGEIDQARFSLMLELQESSLLHQPGQGAAYSHEEDGSPSGYMPRRYSNSGPHRRASDHEGEETKSPLYIQIESCLHIGLITVTLGHEALIYSRLQGLAYCMNRQAVRFNCSPGVRTRRW